jgi:SAM-dependent methyltransferase
MAYNPAEVRDYYDQLGEREWGRFELSPVNRVNLQLHCWHLHQYIHPDDQVLEVGAEPGRFTIELARVGAQVTVADLSPVQLALNQQKVQDAGCEASVVARLLLDVTDLSALPSDRFDAVVCYGGALSYVFDGAEQAVGELLRVTRPGGYVLLSVMSLLGTLRRFLGPALAVARQHGPAVIAELLATHDQLGVLGEQHRFRYYTWTSLQALLAPHPGQIVAAAASNFLAIGNEALLAPVVDDPELWAAYLAWEVACCRELGARDGGGGTHLIAVVQKPVR